MYSVYFKVMQWSNQLNERMLFCFGIWLIFAKTHGDPVWLPAVCGPRYAWMWAENSEFVVFGFDVVSVWF